MDNVCESAAIGPNKGSLGDIEGDEIVEVEVIRGGHVYCDCIEMKLKSGKFLQINRDLDVSRYGITPRIEYKVGSWGRMFPRGLDETDCPGQLTFDFRNIS